MAELTLQDVFELAETALIEGGSDAANAGAIARTIRNAERDGSHSHGLFRLPGYLAGLQRGQVNGQATPEVATPLPGVLRVDAKGGFAPLAIETAADSLAAAARSQGIAMAGITNVHHFAALWPEVEMMAERGCVALAATAALPYVAPAGGAEAVYGTNPLAFAWPRDEEPLAFDQAASARARGDVMIAARDGEAVPEGVGLDARGQPTTDAAAILDGGVQLAFGGYKGASIALMIELLAGPLIGERLSIEAAKAPGGKEGLPVGGEIIIAIDPNATSGGDDWKARAERLFGRLDEIPGVRLPGARRHQNRRSDGPRDIPDAVLDAIKAARAKA